MIVQMPYGQGTVPLELPDSLDASIVEPVFIPALPNPQAAIRESLKKPSGLAPLRDLVAPKDKVGIIFSDITRPSPNRIILPEVLAELDYVPRDNVVLFNALGTHRQNSLEELRGMLGEQIVDNYRIVQNNAFEPATQQFVGTTTFGREIWLNRELLDCDHKILTGFIEPHFFAGFSGGGKAVMPGMAGNTTILGNHSAKMIAHPNSTWGVADGNPVFEEVHEVARKVENLFLLNVALNKNKEITGIFCGQLSEAHATGCAFVKKTAMVPVPEPFDIVITTNSGYPLDLNLYQCVKAMSAAAKIVKPGGAIIVMAECRDGVPEHGLYGSLLHSHRTPSDLLSSIMGSTEDRQDQWQAQIQATIQLKSTVYVCSAGLTDDQIRFALLRPVHDVEELVKDLVREIGSRVRICILPDGPQTVPYVAAT